MFWKKGLNSMFCPSDFKGWVAMVPMNIFQAEKDVLSEHEKITLAVLIGHMNTKTGLCCPSLSTLAAETSTSCKTIIRALEGLEKKGYISRNRSKGRASSKYTLSDISTVSDRHSYCVPQTH
jgi:hypothetical protein